jgi:hypothetical protein
MQCNTIICIFMGCKTYSATIRAIVLYYIAHKVNSLHQMQAHQSSSLSSNAFPHKGAPHNCIHDCLRESKREQYLPFISCGVWCVEIMCLEFGGLWAYSATNQCYWELCISVCFYGQGETIYDHSGISGLFYWVKNTKENMIGKIYCIIHRLHETKYMESWWIAGPYLVLSSNHKKIMSHGH